MFAHGLPPGSARFDQVTRIASRYYAVDRDVDVVDRPGANGKGSYTEGRSLEGVVQLAKDVLLLDKVTRHMTYHKNYYEQTSIECSNNYST